MPFSGDLPITIFDIFSLLYLLQSFRALAQLRKNWRPFWDAEVTQADRRLATELAFFVFIPLGVFLHEAGHALATWQVGGEVVEFQWRVFWGYVVPFGDFTPLENWWISLSGNLVSILLGLLLIPLLLVVRSGIWSELIYAAAKEQLRFALVWYPALSFFGFGDWVTIYNFSLTPFAYLALAAHALLLFSLVRLQRGPYAARRRLARDPEQLAAWQRLEAAAEARPAEAEPWVNLALFALQAGELPLSQHYLRRAARLDPQHPLVHYARAHSAFTRRRYYEAQRAAEAALQCPQPPERQAELHGMIAFSCLDSGRRADALFHYDSAIRLRPDVAHLYYWRAVLRRSLGQRDEARSDFEQAARLADSEDTRRQAQLELEATR